MPRRPSRPNGGIVGASNASHSPARRTHPQPKKRRSGLTPRSARSDHGAERRRQVLACARHALRRGPASLRRELQPLRAPIPRATRAPAHGRARAHRGHGRRGSTRAGQIEPFDARDDVGSRSRIWPRSSPAKPFRRARRAAPKPCKPRRATRSSSLPKGSTGPERWSPMECARTTRSNFSSSARRWPGTATGGWSWPEPSATSTTYGRARPRRQECAIEVVVDRVDVVSRDARRLEEAIEAAWARSDGRAELRIERPAQRPLGAEAAPTHVVVARGLVCPKCARAFEPPRAGLFSYNSPFGACEACRGFGRIIAVDWDKVIPDPTEIARRRRDQALGRSQHDVGAECSREVLQAPEDPAERPVGEADGRPPGPRHRRRGHVARGQVPGRARLVPLARNAHLQDARARPALALPRSTPSARRATARASTPRRSPTASRARISPSGTRRR